MLVPRLEASYATQGGHKGVLLIFTQLVHIVMGINAGGQIVMGMMHVPSSSELAAIGIGQCRSGRLQETPAGGAYQFVHGERFVPIAQNQRVAFIDTIAQQQILDRTFAAFQSRIDLGRKILIGGLEAYTKVIQPVITLHVFFAISRHAGIQQGACPKLDFQRIVRPQITYKKDAGEQADGNPPASKKNRIHH